MKRWSMAVFLVALSACGTLTTHHVLTGQPGAPVTGDVHVVLEGSKESEDVDEVAIVQAVGTGPHAELEELVSGLKTEAQKLGCDAVVRVHVDQGQGLASASGVAGRVRHGAPASASVTP